MWILSLLEKNKFIYKWILKWHFYKMGVYEKRAGVEPPSDPEY